MVAVFFKYILCTVRYNSYPLALDKSVICAFTKTNALMCSYICVAYMATYYFVALIAVVGHSLSIVVGSPVPDEPHMYTKCPFVTI